MAILESSLEPQNIPHGSTAIGLNIRFRAQFSRQRTTGVGGAKRTIGATFPICRSQIDAALAGAKTRRRHQANVVFPSFPVSKPKTTPLPLALIRGPAQGLTPSTREGSATRAYGLSGFACAVIAAMGRTHRAPVARGWSPPPRQEPERCRKPFQSLTPVAGI
jgi:hypothetical protein